MASRISTLPYPPFDTLPTTHLEERASEPSVLGPPGDPTVAGTPDPKPDPWASAIVVDTPRSTMTMVSPFLRRRDDLLASIVNGIACAAAAWAGLAVFVFALAVPMSPLSHLFFGMMGGWLLASVVAYAIARPSWADRPSERGLLGWAA